MSEIGPQLLEPVSVILHLATLPLEEGDVKIAITNHHLIINTSGYYQAAMRKYHGYTREDVSKLFDSVVQLYFWFFSGDTNDPDSCVELGKTHEFRELVRYGITGLKVLQRTYHTGNTVLALQMYINMLNGMLNDDFNPAVTLPDDMYRGWQQRTKLVKEEEMKKIWTLDTLKQLQHTLNDCFNTNNQENLGEDDRRALINSKLDSVKTVLERHDTVFYNLIKQTTGSK